MKHSTRLLAGVAMLLLVGLAGVPQKARANDYLEKEKHFMVYTSGADRIHFTIPVWAEGAYDRYANGDSYVSCTVDGTEKVITYFKSDNGSENEKENNKGTAYLQLKKNMGEIVVTSMYTGVDYLVSDYEAWTEKLIVKQKEDDGYDQVTILEFDWYPPESMNEKDIKVKIVCKSQRWKSVSLLSEQPQMSLADVAAACGYANASTFATNFKQRYTLTPSEFRNKNAETTNNTNI